MAVPPLTPVSTPSAAKFLCYDGGGAEEGAGRGGAGAGGVQTGAVTSAVLSPARSGDTATQLQPTTQLQHSYTVTHSYNTVTA